MTPNSPGTRSTLAWPLGCAMLALVLGSLFVYPRQWTRGFLIADEPWYAEPARNLAEGRGFVTETLYPMFAGQVTALPMNEPFKQIGYPLVGALVGKVTGLSDQLFVAIALAGLALTGLSTWLATHAIVGNRLLAAGITLATIGNPVFLSYWTAALPESCFTALFLGAIWLLLWQSAPARFAAGMLLAISVYFKGFGGLYLPVAGVFLWFESRGRRVAQLGSFSAGAVLTLALASWLLPFGTAQLSGSGSHYAGSMLLFETRGAYPNVEGPFYDTTPLDPFAFIMAHPAAYAEKVARMIGRTRQIVAELGGPAFGHVLFVLLLGTAASVAYDAARRLLRRAEPEPEGMAPADLARVRLLLAGLVAVNFAFFWAGNFKARYFAHLFPLMLAAAVLECRRRVPAVGNWVAGAPRVLTAAAAVYFLAYPPAIGLWKAYHDPFAYLGRMLAVRWVDYGEMARNVEGRVAEDGMVMTDMAHEISWYTGRPTVAFPWAEDQVEYLLDKFDVQALYEHPRLAREWPVLRRRFDLVDDRHGKFWVRRD